MWRKFLQQECGKWKFQIHGGLEGIRTRKQIKSLRAQGQLEGEFTFADALELAETGTIRAKSLPDKIVGCVVPIEILFSSVEHGVVYQLEMDYKSEKEVVAWVEVAQALNLTDISKMLEEVLLMRNVICHPEFNSEHMSEYMVGEQTLYDKFCDRAVEMHREFAEINGVERLRSASKSYLSKHAPHLLPLPTW